MTGKEEDTGPWGRTPVKGGGKGHELTPKQVFRKDTASAHAHSGPSSPQGLLAFLQYALTEDQGAQSLVQGSFLANSLGAKVWCLLGTISQPLCVAKCSPPLPGMLWNLNRNPQHHCPVFSQPGEQMMLVQAARASA